MLFTFRKTDPFIGHYKLDWDRQRDTLVIKHIFMKNAIRKNNFFDKNHLNVQRVHVRDKQHVSYHHLFT